MELHKPQAIIAEDTHRFRVVNCGRRFGKTTLSVEEIKGKAFAKPSRIAYIAPTYQQARDIAWEMLKKELDPIIAKVNESRLELEVKTQTGEISKLFLRGWESIETLRGQQFDFLVIDEIASMRNFWMHWQEVVRPTLTDTQGEALFISTPKGYNHFYDLYQKEGKDKDFKSFSFTTYDNPFIPPKEIDKAKEEITEDRFAQEYMADFRKMEGLVYKEFDRKQHIFDEVAEHRIKEIICGVDFGYTNPAGILKVGIDGDGTYYILGEWKKAGRSTEQIAEQCKLYKPQRVYPDPAEPDRIDVFNNLNINCIEVSKDISAGIDRVRTLFKQNKILVHRDCVHLINELETYHYPERGVDYNSKTDLNEREVPVKENDHLVDALRYALFNNDKPFSKFVEIMQRNEEVYNENEFI